MCNVLGSTEGQFPLTKPLKDPTNYTSCEMALQTTKANMPLFSGNRRELELHTYIFLEKSSG